MRKGSTSSEDLQSLSIGLIVAIALTQHHLSAIAFPLSAITSPKSPHTAIAPQIPAPAFGFAMPLANALTTTHQQRLALPCLRQTPLTIPPIAIAYNYSGALFFLEMAIRNFQNKATKDINYGVVSKIALKLLPRELHRKARIKLARLGAATSMQDLRELKGNRLEALKGDRKGKYSIRINDQYRICFKWKQDYPYDVEIVDYHD